MNYTDRLCPVCGAKLLLVSYNIDTYRNGFPYDGRCIEASSTWKCGHGCKFTVESPNLTASAADKLINDAAAIEAREIAKRGLVTVAKLETRLAELSGDVERVAKELREALKP